MNATEGVLPASENVRNGSLALHLQVIRDYRELQALKPDWQRFTDALRDLSPFVSHACLCAWWSSFGEGGELYVVLAWKDGRICGVAPLMRSRVRRFGMPLYRLGTPYNSHVQSYDWPVEPPLREAFIQALWRHLQGVAPRWDLLEFNQLPGTSSTLAELRAQAAAAGLPYGCWRQGEAPWLPIQGSWEDYVASLSANHRSVIRRKLRRLGDCGEVQVEVLGAGQPVDNSALLEGFRIEAMAWKGSRGTAIVSDPQVHRFYRCLASNLVGYDGLRLYFLRVGGKRIAFHYCLLAGGRLYLLKPGYDSAYARYSPSQLLIWLVLRQAFQDGLVAYEFLGDQDDWKMKWTSYSRPHEWLFVWRNDARGRLLRTLKLRLVPGVKALRRRLRQDGGHGGLL